MKKLIIALALALAACQPAMQAKPDTPIAPATVTVPPAPGAPPILPVQRPMSSAMAAPITRADCEKALFGWDTKSGRHIAGTLANEGVSKRNPRGFQALKSDRGNYRNGKFCGGTAYGWSCSVLPARYDVRTLTKAQAIKLYHGNQWKEIRGDEIISQYLAYKVFDFGVNMGEGTAAILLTKTINDLNGKETDFPVKATVTAGMVKWLNDFTAPQVLADGTENNWRRWAFFERLKLNALSHYGDIIAHNPKLKVWWEVWKRRDLYDE